MGTGTLALWLMLLAGGPPGEPVHLNYQSLKVPIRTNAERRNEIKELHLFVSTDQGRTWTEASVAKPDQAAFPFFAPNDGLYWFTMVVIDVNNRREPADVYSVAPDAVLKVVVDTL